MRSQLALSLDAPPPAPANPETIASLLPRGAAALLECMRVAEEECAAAGQKDAFGLLCPSPVLRGKSLDVYRAHVRELLGRLARGEDTNLGTDAECLCACIYAAGDAPLRQEGQALTEWLFARLFPEQAAKILGDDRARERWDGQVAEDLAQLRKRLARTRRDA